MIEHFIWYIDGILIGITNSSEHGYNPIEGVLHISQSSRTEASPSDVV